MAKTSRSVFNEQGLAIHQRLRVMEVYFFSICSFLVFIFMVFKLIWGSKTKKPKLPPGPWKLPIIGNFHQLASFLPPHQSLRNLANKYGPIMHLQLGEISHIVVSSPEIAKEIMKTHDAIFANRPCLIAADILSYGYTDIAFSPFGSYWRHLRKICTMELLSPKRVQSFGSLREEEVSNLIKTIYSSEGSPINLSEKIFSLSYGITARVAFGKKAKGQEAYISAVKEMTKLAGGFCIADLYPSSKVIQVVTRLKHKLEKIREVVDSILSSIINEHKERKMRKKISNEETEEDFVDILLELQKSVDLDHPLTESNIKAVLLDVFNAGSETSSTLVEWAMSEMLKNPSVMKEAQSEVRQLFNGKTNVNEKDIQELKYLKAVIKETLRIHPPVPLLLPRESSQSCVIDGYEIPVKTKVIVNAWAIGRDPMYWTDPERFIPERFLDSSIDYKGADFEYIPFGAGRRVCPGILFGIAGVELILAKLLFHFDWKFSCNMKPEDLDMAEDFGMSVRRKTDLYLIPIPCYPLSVI